MSLIDKKELIKRIEDEIREARNYAYRKPDEVNYTDDDYDSGYNDAFYDALAYAKSLVIASDEVEIDL